MDRVTSQSSQGPEQDDFQVHPKSVMVSLSNHGRLEQASFDKLRMSGYQWIALLRNRPRVQSRTISKSTPSLSW